MASPIFQKIKINSNKLLNLKTLTLTLVNVQVLRNAHFSQFETPLHICNAFDRGKVGF